MVSTPDKLCIGLTNDGELYTGEMGEPYKYQCAKCQRGWTGKDIWGKYVCIECLIELG